MSELAAWPDPSAFRVDIYQAGGGARIAVTGELDLGTAPGLESAIADLLHAGVRRLVLDLRELDFIDSTGISLILRLDRHARDGGFSFAIVRGPEPVHHVFELVGLTQQLLFVDDPADLAPLAP